MTYKHFTNRLRIRRGRRGYSFVVNKALASYGRFKADSFRRRIVRPFDEIFSRVSIETRTDCNLKCSFCPQSINPRPNLTMAKDVFEQIIDELAEMNFAGRICPLVNNEPLLDDRITDLIGYARQKCPLSFLELLTNGRLLTRELLFDLFAAGLDSLIINDYRPDRDRHPFKLSANLNEIVGLTQDMFRKKVSISLRSTSEQLGNRAGNIAATTKPLVRQFCALPFTGMWIQPEGKAVICCQDFRYQEIMGDVGENTLQEVWFSDKYRRIREELYNKDRTSKICQKCDYPGAPL